jgi:hypothetical protein
MRAAYSEAHARMPVPIDPRSANVSTGLLQLRATKSARAAMDADAALCNPNSKASQ